MDGMNDLNGNAAPEIDEDKKIKNKGLIPVFSNAANSYAINPCPYYEDGNPDMYTVENMEKRK